MKTTDGISPGITGLDVLISLIAFTAIYGLLAVVEFRLLMKAAKAGPELELNQDKKDGTLAVAY